MKNDEKLVFLKKSNFLFSKYLLVVIFLLFQLNARAQDRTISGTVTGTTKEPIPGVTVLVKGTTVGTVTDITGKFTLTVPATARTVVFSFIGMETKEVEIGSEKIYNIVLNETATNLEEVVVVGYGTQKKISVTGAISSVQTVDLIKSPQASIANSLAGRVTGVSTVQYSGQPGADDPTIYVRGIGSLSASASTPLILVDGVERPFSQLDPNEIESISVLKDASATAVYGIRGANGVIIVNTKRGMEGAPQINISTSTGLQIPSGLVPMADSYTWAKSYNDAQYSDNDGNAPTNRMFSDYALKCFKNNLQPLIYSNVDWVDLMVKPSAPQAEANINIRGGTSLVKYFVSLGYLNQAGMINTFNTDNFSNSYGFKKYNYRANFDLDMTKSTRFSLTIGGISGLTYTPNGMASTDWPTLYRSDPWAGQLYEGNKEILIGSKYIGFVNNKNGFSAMHWGTGVTSALSNRMNLDLQLTQKLDIVAKGLVWRFKVSNNSTSGQTKTRSTSKENYDPYFLCDAVPIPANVGDSTVVLRRSGSNGLLGYSESNSKARDWYLETQLTYDHQFGNHQISGLLLYNESKTFYPGTNSDIPTSYVGLAARGTYNYKLKYMLDVNVGYNGSENFAPGKRFGLFPSVGLGWTLTEENFLKNKLAFLNYMKIRYSYGVVGNDKQGSNRFLYLPNSYNLTTSVSSNPGYFFGTTNTTSTLAASESKIGNPDVTWEKSRKQNIGIDLRFFKGNLSASADYFYEYRNNILTTRNTVPSILSITLPAMNIGRVQNQGYEAELTWRSNIGKFNYHLTGNMTYSINKILYSDEVPKAYDYLTTTGRPVGTRWVYQFDGFWTKDDIAHLSDFPNASYTPKPGDARFKDINHDGVIDSFDQIVTGYPDAPQYVFSLSGGADYNGFDISFLFNASTNCSRVLSDTWRKPFQDIGQWALMQYIADNSWTPETASTAILPRITLTGANNNFRASDLYVHDASFIRLKNVEVGYGFTAGALKRLGISRLRIYANGYNLLTFTKLKILDPEMQTSSPAYPLIKIANVGINVTF